MNRFDPLTIPICKKQNGQGFHDLINIEGGFGLKPEVIKDKEKMKPISETIVDLSKYCDDILRILMKP